MASLFCRSTQISSQKKYTDTTDCITTPTTDRGPESPCFSLSAWSSSRQMKVKEERCFGHVDKGGNGGRVDETSLWKGPEGTLTEITPVCNEEGSWLAVGRRDVCFCLPRHSIKSNKEGISTLIKPRHRAPQCL